MDRNLLLITLNIKKILNITEISLFIYSTIYLKNYIIKFFLLNIIIKMFLLKIKKYKYLILEKKILKAQIFFLIFRK